MKKVLAILVVAIFCGMAGNAFAAGSCVQTGSTTDVRLNPSGEVERKYVTLTCTGDGTIASYSFVPKTFGVEGWYLYNVTTDPGTAAPTADYDITLVVDGEDVSGSLLLNRSAANTETVAIAPATKGYHMADGTMVITFANETANPSTIVMKLRFTRN